MPKETTAEAAATIEAIKGQAAAADAAMIAAVTPLLDVWCDAHVAAAEAANAAYAEGKVTPSELASLANACIGGAVASGERISSQFKWLP